MNLDRGRCGKHLCGDSTDVDDVGSSVLELAGGGPAGGGGIDLRDQAQLLVTDG